MRADLVALGIRLGWVGVDEKEEPAVAAVMERLRHEGEGILLIFDNAIDADALKPYLPRGGAARVLVTSNAHAWRGLAAGVLTGAGAEIAETLIDTILGSLCPTVTRRRRMLHESKPLNQEASGPIGPDGEREAAIFV